MSLPSSNANGQSSIRSFFRPKQPTYAPPPSAPKNTQNRPSPPAPPSPAAAAATQPAAITPPSPPAATRPANLHPQASISRILPEHIPALRRITSLLLPVNYPDSFYARLSDPLSSGAFSRVILWRDDADGSNNPPAPAKVVGGLVCRPEPSPFHAGGTVGPPRQPGPTTPSAQPNALYIQSLVLLSPYRGLGLAAALLDEVVAHAALRSEFACETVWAHVWTQNDEGLRWYVARGFARVEEVKGYYFKLRPDSAWIVRREIGGSRAVLDDGSSGFGSGAGGGTGSHSSSSSRGVKKAIGLGGGGGSVTAAAANLPLSASQETVSSPSSGIPPPQPRSLSTTGALPTTTTTTPARPSPSPLPNSNNSSSRSTPGQSFQNARPETEWNDLPLDMQLSKTGSNSLSVPGTSSGASSRSSSTARKKRDRAYPAAAFGNQ